MLPLYHQLEIIRALILPMVTRSSQIHCKCIHSNTVDIVPLINGSLPTFLASLLPALRSSFLTSYLSFLVDKY